MVDDTYNNILQLILYIIIQTILYNIQELNCTSSLQYKNRDFNKSLLNHIQNQDVIYITNMSYSWDL